MSLICYTLRDTDDIYCKFLAETRPDNAIEIKLDTCKFTQEEIKDIFSIERSSFLIASYECEYPSQATEAVETLTCAILSGADFVELSSGIPEAQIRWLISLALNRGCKTIVSYRNRTSTPKTEHLKEFIDHSLQMGADIVKVVTAALSEEDALRVTSLYDYYPSNSLIAYATGEEGGSTRLISYAKDAPVFYLEPCREKGEHKSRDDNPTYFDFVKEESIILRGTPEVPSSNFIFQRAIVMAALSEGETRIYGCSMSDETELALTLAFQLNADIKVDKGVISVTGHQNILENGLKVLSDFLYVGGSLSLAYLCIPLAGLTDKDIRIIGDAPLTEHKFNIYRAALKKLGLTLEFKDNYYLPVSVKGRLHSGVVKLNGEHSPEMISSIIMALSQCNRTSVVHIDNLTDPFSLDLSATIGSWFGLEEASFPEDREDTSRTYSINGLQTIRSTKGLEVERDWTCAAFFLVAGAMMGDVTLEGMDIFSEQGNSVIYDFLDQCRVDIIRNGNKINIRKSIICPFVFDLREASEMLGPLVLLALRADGESCISGIKSLPSRDKALVRDFLMEFRRLGADIHIDGDNMYICGEDSLMLIGGKCSSHDNVFLAMSLVIASLICENDAEIDDIEIINRIFPTFMENIDKMMKK